MHKLHNVKASAPRGPVLGVILLIWVLVTGPQAEYSVILADCEGQNSSDCHLYSVYTAMGCASLLYSKPVVRL